MSVILGIVRGAHACPKNYRPRSLYPVGIGFLQIQTSVRWANSKAGGSTKNGRDSKPKFLGVKKFGGQYVEPGNIILRQRGQRYGIVDSTETVAFGKDYTIYALKSGYVKFWYHRLKRKSYVELLQEPSGPHGQGDDSKYPITKVKSWEYEALAKVVDTALSAGKAAPPLGANVQAGLEAYRAEKESKKSSGGMHVVQAAAVQRSALQEGAAAFPQQRIM